MLIAQHDVVEVRSGFLGLGVYVCGDIPAGVVLVNGWGFPAPRWTKHSVQVDFDAHLEVDPPLVYVNHSCDPNCGLLIDRRQEVLQLHTLHAIHEGEELSIDYDTFEDEIKFMPGQCLCGAQNCRGRIRGFRHLSCSQAEQLVERHGRYVADYLRRELNTAGLEAALPVELR
jgi:hypothetical protein